MIEDRIVAGQMLAEKLKGIDDSPTVLAIPRGGVVVGHEIAKKIGCPLDVVISKKITPPGTPEYAVGAITHDGSLYKGPNWELYSSTKNFTEEIRQKQAEVNRRLQTYRGNTNYDLSQKTVILVDDGIATGSTIFAILNWLKKMTPKQIVLAVPVLPQSTYQLLQSHVQKIVFLERPVNFSAVGQFFNSFEQVADDEVRDILANYDLPKTAFKDDN